MRFYNDLFQTPHRNPHLSHLGVWERHNQSISIFLRDRNFFQAGMTITNHTPAQMRASIFDGMVATCSSSDHLMGNRLLPLSDSIHNFLDVPCATRTEIMTSRKDLKPDSFVIGTLCSLLESFHCLNLKVISGPQYRLGTCTPFNCCFS